MFKEGTADGKCLEMFAYHKLTIRIFKFALILRLTYLIRFRNDCYSRNIRASLTTS